MSAVSIIQGVGPEYQKRLNVAGVYTIESLLKASAAKNGRKQLSDESGISEKLILKWANHADLSRITGISTEYSELLEAAGVDSIAVLATCKADRLCAKLAKVNTARDPSRDSPPQNQVAEWIAAARTLPRILQY